MLVRFFLICCIIGLLGLVDILSPKGVKDGFNLANISTSIVRDPMWNIPMEDETWIDKACHQPFDYLATGAVCHAFVSRDRQYVIKFFRHRRWRLNKFLHAIPLPSFFEEKRREFYKIMRSSVAKAFMSCIAAYSDFKEETGVLYLHFTPSTHLGIDLKVKDRLGVTHVIPLDEVDFVLQKMAVRTDDYLLSLREKGEHTRAKKAVTMMLNFVLKRARKGYNDSDPHFILNFGFIDDKVVEVDIGGFYRDANKGLEYFYEKELKKIKHKFLPWVKRHYPKLINHVKNELERIEKTEKLQKSNKNLEHFETALSKI